MTDTNGGPQDKSFAKTLKKIFWSKEHTRNHLSLMVMFACGFLIYYIALYNSITLKGNILYIGILFGLAEVVGIFFSERVIALFDPI